MKEGEIITNIMPMPENQEEWDKMHIMFATSNGNIWKTSNTSATPVMIACYTSRLEISAGRQILTYT